MQWTLKKVTQAFNKRWKGNSESIINREHWWKKVKERGESKELELR